MLTFFWLSSGEVLRINVAPLFSSRSFLSVCDAFESIYYVDLSLEGLAVTLVEVGLQDCTYKLDMIVEHQTTYLL